MMWESILLINIGPASQGEKTSASKNHFYFPVDPPASQPVSPRWWRNLLKSMGAITTHCRPANQYRELARLWPDFRNASNTARCPAYTSDSSQELKEKLPNTNNVQLQLCEKFNFLGIFFQFVQSYITLALTTVYWVKASYWPVWPLISPGLTLH